MIAPAFVKRLGHFCFLFILPVKFLNGLTPCKECDD